MNSENQTSNSSHSETNNIQTNTNTIINKNDEQDNVNKMIYIYQNFFVSSVITIVNLIKSVSETNDDKISSDKKASHEKLRTTCIDISNQYKNTTENIDQVRIIKKVFKVLSANYKLIKEKNNTLFSVRTNDGKIMTIIPGLNINLCIDFLDNTQHTTLWDSIESMFVTSVKMVYLMTDKSRHDKDILELVGELEQKSLKKLNNFFMGLNNTSDTAELSMEQLMTSDIVIPGTEANSGLLGKLGVDKLMNPEALADEIKKFSEDDVTDTINTLTSMLGNDTDIKDVCSTMVKSVLEDIKTNGIENMFSIAERVSGKLSGKIDADKMAKTASGMSDLLNNNQDKFDELKDENGNLVGANFLKQFQNTLNMAKMFQKK
jgi:hypothetical protein